VSSELLLKLPFNLISPFNKCVLGGTQKAMKQFELLDFNR
jgi:hypothetical protein